MALNFLPASPAANTPPPASPLTFTSLPTPAVAGTLAGAFAVPAPPPSPPVEATPGPKVTLEDMLNKAPTTPKSKANARKKEIEEKIGETVGIRTKSPEEILALTRDGVLVEVVVRRWRGTSRLTAEELGLTDDVIKTFAEQHLSLGTKHLIPKELAKDLEAAEVAARQALYSAGFKTTYGRFVTTQRFKAFRSTFEHAEERFNTKIEELCTKLDEIKNGIRDEFVPLAHRAWMGQRVVWNGGTLATIEVAPPEFVAQFVEKVVAQIPSASEIKAGASFSYTLNILHAPDTTLAAQFATGDEEINAELTAHLQQKKKDFIDDFLVSMRDGLAEQVQALVAEVHKTTEGKENIHGKTLGKILNAIADLRELNITNDTDIEATLSGLASYIDVKKSSNSKDNKTSTKEVMEQLKLASAQVTATAKISTKSMFHGM